MAGNSIQHGEILFIDEMLKSRANQTLKNDSSVRITARLDAHDCTSCRATLCDPHSGLSLAVNTTLVEPFEARIGSIFQMIGELEINGNQMDQSAANPKSRGLILKARIVRCVDGIDLIMYRKATDTMRGYLQSRTVDSLLQ